MQFVYVFGMNLGCIIYKKKIRNPFNWVLYTDTV